MIYEIKGIFRMGNHKRHFRRQIEAETEKMAREKIYSLLGSEHRARRHEIDIEEMKEL